MYGGPSEVAGQAVIRGVLLPMTVHAIPHIEVDIALRNRLVRDVAMTRRAFDVGADVRRVIEPDVRTGAVAVDTLPVEIHPLLRHLRDLLNPRLVGRDRGVADQAGVHAREAGLRALGDRLMAVLRAGEALLDVRVVREFN